MKYYLYQHIREDKDEVFYIGIGTKSKQDIKCNSYSRAYSKHIDNNIWLKIVAKTKWRYEILIESDDREYIQNKEIEIIDQYGRKCDNTGTLANLTLGGESNRGYIFTQEQKDKISAAQIGQIGRRLGTKLTDEQKENISLVQKEVANRPEMIELRRNLAIGNQYHKGHKHAEESKALMSKAAKERGVNAKTVSCILIDKNTQQEWKANSISELSRTSPLSISILNKLANNYRANKKITEQYEFKRLNNE